MTSIPTLFGALFKKRAGHPDPARDWVVLLGVSLLLLAGSIGWNAWFFSSVVNEEVQAGLDANDTLETYDASRIKALFEEREASASAYRETHSFVDPSR